MKLNTIEQTSFNKYDDVTVKVTNLFNQFGDKEVYELLKSYVEDISSFKGLVEVKANHQYNVSYEHIDNSYYNVFHVLLNTLSEKEKEYLLDVALESNERAATIFLKNPEVKLTPAQFNTVFNNKHHSRHSIRKAVIGNKNIPLSMEQVNEGLLKWDDGLNIVYAQRGHSCVLKKTIDILINETNSDSCFNEDVLEELLKNKNLHFDEMQIKHFLNSDNFILRAECARNYNIPFTPEQIIQGLNDEGFEYDGYDDTYSAYSPSDVKAAFLTNPNIKIPNEEIQGILSEYKPNEYLIELIAQRADIDLEDRYVQQILKMQNRATVSLLQNESIHLNDHQLLGFLYKDTYTPDFLAKFYLSRANVLVSDLVMSVLKSFPNEEIKKIVSEKESMQEEKKLKL